MQHLLFDSGYKVASVLLHFSAMLGSTVDTDLRLSTVLFAFPAMLGSTVDTYLRQSTELFRVTTQCLVRQWIQIVLVYGVLSYFSAMLGSTVDTYRQVQSPRLFQLLALPTGMRVDFLGPCA